MKLLVKFNLIFLVVFGIGLAVAAYISANFLQQNAREQVVQQARLMMQTTLSTRNYTSTQVRPLIEVRSAETFHPQTVPAYAATETFNYLREHYPDYSYKEATLNPTNLRDRAVDWEADIVNNFRNHPAQKELVGERDSPTGRTLFLARPLSAPAPCLECHSTPDHAPRGMIKVYGSSNGFGWQEGETIGAQIVSVPMALPLQLAGRAFRALMTSLAGVAVFVLLALNAALVLAVIRPVSQLSKSADEISKGNLDVPELVVKGKDEIATLADSFNRMHRSLRKAMKMLESE
jgi:protein-histidine pros-kinase